MTAYNETKDKKLFEKEIQVSLSEAIFVGVYSYDEKEPKLSLKRQSGNAKTGKFYWDAIGRISLTEWFLILPTIDEAIQFLSKNIQSEYYETEFNEESENLQRK